MVVFRSPVQRQGRAAGFSTSPAPSTAMYEDPESIFNATPGPARARSVDVGGSGARHGSSHVKSHINGNSSGIPGSAILQQRLAHSLMMVAESPSSKMNAPDPFRPRKQLRRSPPAAEMLDHPLREQDKQSMEHETIVEEHEEVTLEVPVASIHAEEPTVPSVKGKERGRNFELAAKALFDSARGQNAPSHTKGRASLPGTLQFNQVFLTPQASSQRHAAAIQEDEIHRSAPMRPSTSNTCIVSAPAGSLMPPSPGSPGKITATPVKSLAKIGRLTARTAHLETKLQSVTSELDSILQAHQELQEQLDFVTREKEAAQERIAKFELIANECEDLIESHERLELANVDLQERRRNDIVELETVKEEMGNLKWKERKLRYELSIRREEGIYREFELQNDQLNPVIRQLRLEKCQLQVAIADLQESISILKYEKRSQDRTLEKTRLDLERYEEVTKTHQEDLTTLQTRLDKRTRVIAELEAEQREFMERLDEQTNENERLATELEEAQRKIVELERKSAAEEETHSELMGNKTAVKRLEKEVEKLQGQLTDRTAKLDKQMKDLKSQLDDKNTQLEGATKRHDELFKKSEDQLKHSKKDLKALEKKYAQLEQERDQLKNDWDMHRRASRVFGDGPSQTDAEAAAGSSLRPLADNGAQPKDNKRKRGKGKVAQTNSEDEQEDEKPNDEQKAASVPKAPKARPTLSSKPLPAKLTTSKASKKRKADISDDEDEEDKEEEEPARPAKRNKPQPKANTKLATSKAKAKASQQADVSDSGSGPDDAAPPNNEVKRERRRTAIKSGVPDQFRQKLKEEADNRVDEKKSKKRKQQPESSAESSSAESQSESSDSESDTIFVQSSPKATLAKSKAATKTPAQASQGTKAASNKLKNAIKDEAAVTSGKSANTSSKSAPSASAPTTTATGKKKVTLHKSVSSQFIWGGDNLGGSQRAGSKSLIDLPDILSPVVKR